MPELSFPSPALADDVVALRPWLAADVPDRMMAFADPVVQRFASSPTRPYTQADAREFFAHQEHARLRGEELAFAFVEPADADVLLGGGSVYGIDPGAGRATVGYWTAAEARGRGVATHATRLMARWAFDSLGIARLELTCAPDNERSQRVAERCGFVREGLLRSHMPFKDGRRDTVLFSLLPGEIR